LPILLGLENAVDAGWENISSFTKNTKTMLEKKHESHNWGKPNRNNVPILLMEEILHHLGWCQNLVNNGR